MAVLIEQRDAGSVLGRLRLSAELRRRAAALEALAAELELRAHEDLGRLAAEAVERAAGLATAESAAEAVADALLGLSPHAG